MPITISLALAALAGAAVAAAVILLGKRFFRRLSPPEPAYGEPTEWDRRFMAYHEAGHAVASRYLPERPPLEWITIDPSDAAFGMIRTALRPHHNETRRSLLSTVAVLLAGRIAEELFLGEVTTSCVHDLAAARRLAADMVVDLGMGERSGAALPPDGLPPGTDTMNLRDADIRRILSDADGEVRELLSRHGDDLRRLAAKLLAEKTLAEAEINAFFAETD